MDKIKVGVVGLKIGRGHAQCFHQYIDEAVLVAIAERKPITVGYSGNVTREEFCQSLGVPLYQEGLDMIEHADLDAVSLAVTPKDRLPLLEAAGKKGIAVLMEKPMACDSEQAGQMKAIIDKYQIPFMVEYPFRFFPVVVRLKELIESGELGELISVTEHYQTAYNAPRDHWTWDPCDGNGLINEYVTHAFDNINYLCGKPVSLYAVGRDSSGLTDMEDAAAITVNYENGSVAMLNAGGYGTQAFNFPTLLHVYGTNGEARVSGNDWLYARLEFAHKNDTVITVKDYEPPARFDLMEYNLRAFCQYLQAKKMASCTFEDGLISVKMAEAARRSCRSGNVEKLEW